MLIREIDGLEVHTISLNSDSFTIYDGDAVAGDFLKGSKVDKAAMQYRLSQINTANNKDPETTNRELLTPELADLSAERQMMFIAGDTDPIATEMIDDAYTKKHRYAHHQQTDKR